ncbi:MAG: biotin/lipoyl-containing protein [Saprospiraceae bacterium]
MYKIISDHHEENIDIADIKALDIHKINADQYHVLESATSYDVRIENENRATKYYGITVNGNYYKITIQDEYDQLISQMGLNSTNDQKVADITAPMPGLILDIMVNDGDQITKGSPLLILEAMKMENVIKAVGDGVIKKIISQKGEAVNKGQIIIEMEK